MALEKNAEVEMDVVEGGQILRRVPPLNRMMRIN